MCAYAETTKDMLVTYISSYAPPYARYHAVFNNTCATCKQYVQLNSGDNYAINGWNCSSAPHQVHQAHLTSKSLHFPVQQLTSVIDYQLLVAYNAGTPD